MSKFINKIVNSDSLEILKKIPDKTFNLIFADPPYNLQIGKILAAKVMLKPYTQMNTNENEKEFMEIFSYLFSKSSEKLCQEWKHVQLIGCFQNEA